MIVSWLNKRRTHKSIIVQETKQVAAVPRGGPEQFDSKHISSVTDVLHIYAGTISRSFGPASRHGLCDVLCL